MKQVLLRFMLEHGHFLDVITTDTYAKQLVKDWSEGKLDTCKMTGFDPTQERSWGIDPKRIMGLFADPLDKLQEQAQVRQGGSWQQHTCWSGGR